MGERSIDENRLAGIDASFLYAETPSAPMHTLKLLVLDAKKMPGGYRFERVASVLAAAIELLPRWQSRVKPAPFGFDHPHWEIDAGFDFRDHVGRIVLGAPAAGTTLDRIVADVLAVPLARDRPLWHVTVVEGLPDGRVALVMKIHHALADGTAFARILSALARPVGPTSRRDVLVPADRRQQPISAPLWAVARRWARLPALVGRTIAGRLRRWWRRRTTGESAAYLFRGPATPINGRLTAHRAFARVSVSWADVKLVKHAFKATVNDVVLALVSEALRRWLERQGGSVDRSLIAGVPMSADTDEDRDRTSGNKLSHVAVALHTHVADPVERLLSIHRSASVAKAELEASGRGALTGWSELATGSVMRWMWRMVQRLPRPPINVIVSCVPGPPKAVSIAGAEICELFSVGPLLEGIALNVTAWSYRDRLNFGVLTCPECMADLSVFASDLHDGLARLVSRALVKAA